MNAFAERNEGTWHWWGLVRVSTSKQETARQHDALDPICERVFEEKISGSLALDARPALSAAIDYMRSGDMLTVQEVDRLGRNLLEGLLVLNDLFSRGIAVKVLDGIAAGEHTERSLILDLALVLAEDRRRDIGRKTRDGLAAARARGRTGGRPRVVDADKRRIILARHTDGESIRTIARATKVSVGTRPQHPRRPTQQQRLITAGQPYPPDLRRILRRPRHTRRGGFAGRGSAHNERSAFVTICPA